VISAAILAGGRARRFGGRDKSALVVEGRRVIDRQIEALAPLAGEILLVGAAGTPPSGVRAVPDRTPGRGPLGGLDAALAAASGDPTVLVACDMPFLSTALLRRLVELAGDADAAMPRTDRGYHPLCAAYARVCRAVVARHLAEGRLRLTDLVHDLRVRTLDAGDLAAFGDPDRLLANLNTPEDYRVIAARHSYEPSS
jgi:molybdopterin-guanine dinucleotide biosynthesis protein A